MTTLGENRRLPQVQIRELRDDYCEFVLSDTDPSVANALRRIMQIEVSSSNRIYDPQICVLCFLVASTEQHGSTVAK